MFIPQPVYYLPILRPLDWKGIKIKLDAWGKQHDVLTAAQRIWEAGIKSETHLDLSALYLKCLPPEIGFLTNLKGIDLSHNLLSELPGEFAQLANLKYIYLNDNRLTQFPKEICRLPKLQYLSVAVNRLTELPGEIGSMKSLEELSVERNALATLPRQIGQLSHLTLLRLSFNRLTELPEELGNLQKLAMLHLSYNHHLEDLPSSMERCRSLLKVETNATRISPMVGAILAADAENLRNKERLIAFY